MMCKGQDNPLIGIFGHYGQENLGDESIIEAVIQNIKSRIPSAEIHGFSLNPVDTAKRFDIQSFPIRLRKTVQLNQNISFDQKVQHVDIRHKHQEEDTQTNSIKDVTFKEIVKKIPVIYPILKFSMRRLEDLIALAHEISFLYTIHRYLKSIDILMITGSNQFLDNFGGPWGFPYTLLKWSLLAKLTGAKVYYVSVGAGPITNQLSMLFIRWATYYSDYISLRDKGSAQLIKKIGVKINTHVYPDLAHSLDIKHIQPHKLKFSHSSDQRLPIIGINPMPLYDSRYWCVHDKNKYSTYLEKMTEFASRLFTEKYPFFFFATQPKDINTIQDILVLLSKRHGTGILKEKLVLNNETVDDLMANIASADMIVATRFHGTVLSLLSEKPLLGICYYWKARELLREMGQEDYAVDLDAFTVNDLWAKFKLLESNLAESAAKIKAKNIQYRNALDEQYDVLFAAVIPTTHPSPMLSRA